MVSHLNISKDVLLDPSLNSDLSIKITQMETSLLKQVKEYLIDNNIQIKDDDNINDKYILSNTILIIKNIPYSKYINNTRNILNNIYNRYGN